jgi:hypothetical protein
MIERIEKKFDELGPDAWRPVNALYTVREPLPGGTDVSRGNG